MGQTTGGTGGSGIGGNGGTGASPAGSSGNPNTGSGGGGSESGLTSGSGGSGIVILRCTKASASFSAGVVVNGTTTSDGQSVNGDTTNMPSGEYFYSITTAASGATITF